VVHGIDPRDESGHSVSSAGDVNGDGYDDILMGAYRADPHGLTEAGESYVVFGRAPAPPCAGDINTDGFTNAADFVILAGTFGSAVPPGTSSDLDGNGTVDLGDFTILVNDFGCVQ
jgi:hypothetical protein